MVAASSVVSCNSVLSGADACGMVAAVVLGLLRPHRQPALCPVDVTPRQFADLRRAAKAGMPREPDDEAPLDGRAGVEDIPNRFHGHVAGPGWVGL